MEKYGFVYIWFDRKHKRYYIGSHWGTEDDGYICSSRWMRKAYKRRPEDFKRRILKKITSIRNDILIEEHKWLQQIKNEELGKKYYNLTKHLNGHWSTDENKALSVKEKLKLSDNTRGIRQYWKDRTKSEEHKKKISNTLKGKPLSYAITEDMKKQRSDNSKRLQKEKKIGMHGRKHTEETLHKMSTNNAMNNPEYRSKARDAKKGAVCLIHDGRRKFAQLNTPLYDTLIGEGFKPINKKRHNTKEEANRARSEALKGHGVTEQTREKMRISRLLYIAQQKAPL